MKKMLEDSVQIFLRKSNIISAVEVVYKFGDLYIAEDTISGAKRNIDPSQVLTESSDKRVLKG